MDGMQQGAFGAGRAGGAFDPLTFIQQPHTGLRIVSWLFSLVIFGCIANEGYINRPDEVEQFCIFNRNQNACNYAVSMGSLAFLCCMAFLALDAYFPQISSVKDRKKAVLADVGTSGRKSRRSGPSFGSWAFVSWPISGRWQNRRTTLCERAETRHGRPSPSPSSPSSPGEALRCSLWRDLSVCVLKRSMRSSLHTRINVFPVRVEPQLSS
ncbi:synaptogyrin-1-like isoform X3 [Megalobrama amblycephala]|uniref:synaptogyrin-1-like isoform X3 n=1 Tax=Megalobrama amblycephala TaxID=75352 RepID=UPI002013FB6B|nr:synaptogyrin-1-like isoform X3 [Megalobrama amblycephala]